MSYRIPDGKESYDKYGNKYESDIPRMHADRIGIDDEGTLRVSKSYDAILLLYPA